MNLLNELFEIVIIPFVEFVASPFVFLMELLKDDAQKKNETF